MAVDMKIEGFRNVPWIYAEYNSPMTGPASHLDDEAAFSLDTTSEELNSRRDAVAIDLMRYVFFATNWAEAANSDATLERWIKKGYEYNFWPVPARLLL